MGGPATTSQIDPPAAIEDCWNKIGVWGDASCPELERYAHCRNCPVYSAAAKTLLDRDLPEGYVAGCTDHFAEPKVVRESETHSAIIFRLGPEWFALQTDLFDEIAETRKIHSLPHRRSASVLGLVNVRGELIICVSLARMLGLEGAASAKSDRDSIAHERLAVIHDDTGRIAFPVDEVQRTHRLTAGDVKQIPATISKSASNYTKGILAWRDRLVGVLDHESIFKAVNRTIA